METLLTITIPTYNRCAYLDLLLESIANQLAPVNADVHVIVVDNHSSDETPACVQKWAQKIERLEYIRNVENIGMSRNIIKCFNVTQSIYCWIIGDDDLLRLGALQAVVAVLKQHQPDLMHINGAPFLGSPAPQLCAFSGQLTPRILCNESFIRIVHVYMTFISCMIIKKRALCRQALSRPLNEHENTVIPQLAWILDMLNHCQRFVYLPQRLVLARRQGSGGYNLYQTFSLDLAKILDQKIPGKMGRIFKQRTVLKYLPSLIIMTRKNMIGDFTVTRNDEFLFKRAYSGFSWYWLLIVPLLRLPLPLAKIAYYASRVASKFVSVYDRVWAYWLIRIAQ